MLCIHSNYNILDLTFFDFEPLGDLLFLSDVPSDLEVLLEGDLAVGPNLEDVCVASVTSLRMSFLRLAGTAVEYSSVPGTIRMRLSSQSMS